MNYDARSIKSFRKTVWKYWKRHGRHELSWRKTKNPYRILVSEVMLQQTQVARVGEKYPEFLKAFPTLQKLAKAPLSKVLKTWSGMGYNRRAKYLRDAAKIIVAKHNGKVPKDRSELGKLPSIGPYTADAVRVFAFSEPDVLIETNIRAAYIQHFFSKKKEVSDAEILSVARTAAKGQNSCKWHWALMDYGAHLKKIHNNPTRNSAHYVKQSKFEGSLRQVRGAILRVLVTGGKIGQSMHFLIRANKKVIDKAFASLARDELIVKEKGKWRVA